MEGAVTTEGEMVRAAWKDSRAINRGMGLLTPQCIRYVHAFLGKKSLYELKDDMVLK